MSSNNVNSIATLTLTISNPSTQAQVQAILAKLNDLMSAFHRCYVAGFQTRGRSRLCDALPIWKSAIQ